MTGKTLGIDVTDRGAHALFVDDAGQVLKRFDAEGTGALEKVLKAAGSKAAGPAGIAVDPSLELPRKRIHATAAFLCSPGAAAISAEAWVGAAQGAGDAICLWIGERVFAGLMLDGRPRAGTHGYAGSAAWLALNPVERRDYRTLGNLAAEVSSAGIARRLSWRIQSGDESRVLDRAGSLDAITAAHVFDGAREGDGVAISVVRETAKYIGMAVANLACTVDPELVVLTGEIADASDLLFESVRQECAKRLPPGLASTFELRLSPLGLDAVAIGAARLASAAAV